MKLSDFSKICSSIPLWTLLFVFSVCAVSCGNNENAKHRKEKEISEKMAKASEFMVKGDPSKSLEILRQIAKENPENLSMESKNQLVRCYSNIGYILFFCNQDYIGSYEALITGKELAESLPNCRYLPELYLNLANVFGVYGDTRLAQSNFIKAFDEALYRQNWDVLLTTVYNLLSFEMAGGLDKEGKARLERFKKLDVPDHPMRPLVSNILEIYTLHAEGKPREAIGLLQKIRGQRYGSLTPRRISTLCDLYSLRVAKEGGLDEDYAAFARKLETELDSADTDIRGTIYHRLASFYTDRGDHARALRNLRLGNAVSDSTFAISNYSMLHDMHLLNKQKSHEHEMAVEKEREHRLMTWMLAGCLCLIVMVVSIAVIAGKNKRLMARNKELFNRFQETQKLEEEIVELRKATVDTVLEKEHPSFISESYAGNDGSDPEAEDTPYNEEAYNGEAEEATLSDQLRPLADKVVRILNDEQEVTCADFTLEKLARLTKSNRNYVSQVVNTLYRKNFNSVVGEIRVRTACRRLSSDPSYRNLTIEALAEEVGFKSRSNFVVVFKRITGLSPSDYRKTMDTTSRPG